MGLVSEPFVGSQFGSQGFGDVSVSRKGTSYAQGDKFSVRPFAQGEFVVLRSVFLGEQTPFGAQP